ncbi:MAG: dUTP diphosphatase [Ignavibacteriales bacterium]|nr:dUTP diphosphatase [Ignavibacteriales bacterium]MCF8305697.1 dUTP diphosphatase [Ignavibacteriales bacterium]MCF8315419.1 dUTP diphosphatase [Ignavibacteriales bacterium]MCF8438663.1 dUTP diphosphatase [Ignavibacteriales bacterium]
MFEQTVKIKIKRISSNFRDIEIPAYSTPHSSGMDIRAALENEVVLPAGKTALIPTDLSVEIPPGYEIQVRPRSGLAAKNGIGILNAPGTIDADYRGEIKVILFNFSSEDFLIRRGDRIAQIIVAPVVKAEIEISDDLSQTDRGSGGFGSSGTR